MLVSAMVEEIKKITRRPDKGEAALRCINDVISKSSFAAMFPLDFYEEEIAIQPDELVGTIVIATQLPRLRRIQYIVPKGAHCPMKKITPREYIKGGYTATSVYYLTGGGIAYRLGKVTTALQIGYLQAPPVLIDDTSTYWMMEMVPYMIIEGAAALLFRGIGEETSARQHEAEYRIQLDSLINDIGEPDNER